MTFMVSAAIILHHCQTLSEFDVDYKYTVVAGFPNPRPDTPVCLLVRLCVCLHGRLCVCLHGCPCACVPVSLLLAVAPHLSSRLPAKLIAPR